MTNGLIHTVYWLRHAGQRLGLVPSLGGGVAAWTLERPDAELFAKALMEPATLGPQLSLVAKRYKERFLKP